MERLFGAIRGALADLGKNKEVEEALVFAAWNRCAGAEIRRRSAPLEFFEKRLVVAVVDETWRVHLEDLAPQIVAKLNGHLGQDTVRFIELRLDRSMASARRRSLAPGAETEEPEVPFSVARAAEAIANERLREVFLSAAASYLGRKEDKRYGR
jgi:hypothetical protein